MRTFHFERETELRARLEDVFSFFADARNLDRLTPPWLHFEILTPGPVSLRAGTRIDYRLRLRGVPIRWTSEITVWEPPHRFVDEQAHGPYRLWVHEHLFERKGEHTKVVDRVEYAVLGGWLAERLIVRRDLERVFDYRKGRMREILGV